MVKAVQALESGLDAETVARNHGISKATLYNWKSKYSGMEVSHVRRLKELEEESSLFQGARPFAMGMAVYTAILWVGALLGVISNGGWVSQLLSLIAMIVALYISWVLVQGVLDMERSKAADLNGAKLYQWWKGLVAIQVAAKLLYLMANLANISILLGLATVLVVVGFVVIVLYLLAWWKSAGAYEALPRQGIDPEME